MSLLSIGAHGFAVRTSVTGEDCISQAASRWLRLPRKQDATDQVAEAVISGTALVSFESRHRPGPHQLVIMSLGSDRVAQPSGLALGVLAV